jgi:hypothetical protein
MYTYRLRKDKEVSRMLLNRLHALEQFLVPDTPS